ncbi:MAG: phospholipase D-like domain-containing protein [Bacteroidota bacterium]
MVKFKNPTNEQAAPTLYQGGIPFLDALENDLKKASHSIAIQVMSFEADQAGQQIVELLSSYPKLQRRLLVDTYSTIVVNDTWTQRPGNSPRLRAAREEARQLWPLFQQAMNNGIEIRFTQPLGPLFLKYPFRNHKKCVLIDQAISYVGGINITDHNFGWNDLMIRDQHTVLAQALQQSFDSDWQAGFLPKKLSAQKANQVRKEGEYSLNPTTQAPTTTKTPPPHQSIDSDTELYLLNGLSTKAAYRDLQERVEQAKKVEVFSPYLSYPMLDSVAKVTDHTIWVPETNNKAAMTGLLKLPRYRKLNIQTVPGTPENMLHAKVMVLEEETLMYGSSNFDLISYLFEKELVIVRRNAEMAAEVLDTLRP